MTWLGTWAKRIKITIDADQIDAALSNFPVPIYLSAASGISDDDVSCVFDELASDGNRKKIAITTSDGETQCYVEIERWDDANEKAWLHVKVPSVSESADTDLYLYYDSTQSDNTAYVGDTTDAAAKSVWDANYVGVWHLQQDPSGGTGAVKESTSYGFHGTSTGSMTSADLVDGLFGKAIDFDGSDDAIQLVNNNAISPGDGSFTMEALVKPSAVNSNYHTVYMDSGTVTANTISLDITNANKFRSYFKSGTNKSIEAVGTTTPDTSTWYSIAAVKDDKTARIYVNGQQENSYTNQNMDTVSVGSGNVSQIGRYYLSGTALYHFAGLISSVRLSNVARSAAWLKATYYGLFDALLVFGSEELIPSAILAEITDCIAFDDTLDVLDFNGNIAETLNCDDTIDGVLLTAAIIDETTTDDVATRIKESYPIVTDETCLSASFSCLNWTAWLRQNSDLAVKRFYFTLTGSRETPPISDVEIPISSFQTRLRQSEPTYLSVVIPDVDTYASAVTARSNGQMVVEMAYLLDGVESVREEICRVDLESVDIYEGARNQSISLSGHITETYATKITALTGASYYNLSGGLRRYRCAMDPYLRPGDTVRVNGEEFTAGSITLSRSVSSETMEVLEAES